MTEQQLQKTFSEILKKFDQNEQELIKRAFYFAQAAHGEQKRKSGEFYIAHPVETARILADLKLDANTVAAGLMHDVPEDTDITLEGLEKEFGPEITYLVNGVTKLTNVRLRGTHQPVYVENLRKMFVAAAEDLRVVLIKLADRLHNMRTIEALPENKRQSIARETLEIYAPLANRLGIGEIKGELEDLAFPHVYPKEYQALIKRIETAYEERKAYVGKAIEELEKLLKQENITYQNIHGRAKHLYSLHNKLKKYDNQDLNFVTDLMATRIIVSSTTECYAVMGTIHQNYKPLPGKIKDYISTPKPNGYQSLHTTIFGPEGKILEVQIRTEKMHEFAEHGIAAHWTYTETGKNQSGGFNRGRKLAWIKQLREVHQRTQDTEELLSELKLDFFQDRIFCFTPLGDVIDLPAGSTPIDFAFAIHSDLGFRCQGAKINGSMTKISTPLNNGDVVEILAAKNPVKISRDWLNIVKTSRGREQVRKYLRENKSGPFSLLSR